MPPAEFLTETRPAASRPAFPQAASRGYNQRAEQDWLKRLYPKVELK